MALALTITLYRWVLVKITTSLVHMMRLWFPLTARPVHLSRARRLPCICRHGVIGYTRHDARLHIKSIMPRPTIPIPIPIAVTIILVLLRLNGGDTASVRVPRHGAGGIVGRVQTPAGVGDFR